LKLAHFSGEIMRNFLWLCCAFTVVFCAQFSEGRALDTKDLSFSDKVIHKTLETVVFIGVEHNPFDATYGSDPGFYTCLQPVYECLWPNSYFQGTGFVVDERGYILTNAHVVDVGTSFQVIFPHTGAVYTAKIIGKDLRTDLAVLKISSEQGESFPYLEFANYDTVKVGDPLIVCGNPFSLLLNSTLTRGVVSALDRNCFMQSPIEGYLQTDAAINPGNSGSPVLNEAGDVIAVAVLSFDGQQGLNLAIPSSVAKNVTDQFVKYGKIKQGFLGIGTYTEFFSIYQTFYGEGYEGSKVDYIVENSPAEAVLQKGDIIIEMNHRPIRSSLSLRNQVAILEPETQIELTINRDGDIQNVQITLGSEKLSERFSEFFYPYDWFIF